MNKKIFYYISMLCLIVWNVVVFTDVWWQLYLGSDNTILNIDWDLALDIDDNNNPITDPLRQWAYKIIDADYSDTISDQELIWVINPWLINNHDTAMNSTMQIIKNLINYALGLLSLIALIYLIYHGFLMLTAAGDDTQYKTGFKWLKFAVIALVWVWLSRLVVSFIFWIIASFS